MLGRVYVFSVKVSMGDLTWGFIVFSLKISMGDWMWKFMSFSLKDCISRVMSLSVKVAMGDLVWVYIFSVKISKGDWMWESVNTTFSLFLWHRQYASGILFQFDKQQFYLTTPKQLGNNYIYVSSLWTEPDVLWVVVQILFIGHFKKSMTYLKSVGFFFLF